MITGMLTIIAIIIGPIAAVVITLWWGSQNEKRRRKTEILASLMRTRATPLSDEHVGALNLVQLEFHNRVPIISAHKSYIEHLNRKLPPVDQQPTFAAERNNLLLELIAAIGLDLNYNLDKKDLEVLSYCPQAWQNDVWIQRENMRLLSRLLKGERSLHVSSMNPEQGDLFPPPPE